LDVFNCQMGAAPNGPAWTTVSIRTLANPKVREYCNAFSVPLKR
jgi:hypothetical protein